MASKEFKELDHEQQRYYVGRVKALLDAGYREDQIIKLISNLGEDLVKEMIEMVKTAYEWKAQRESN